MQLAAMVETGSFAAAAAKLGTSQPAISRDIAFLEARLGAQLFDRTARPVQPSALCEALAEEGRAILFAREQAILKIERASSGTTGVLRIAGPPMLMDHVVTPICASFHSRHPAVEIQTQPAYIVEATSLLRSRKVDVAICAVEVFAEDGIDMTLLMASRNVIACRLNHPLTREPAPKMDALLAYGWVAPPEGSPLDRDLRAGMEHLGASTAAIRFRSATSAGLRSYLERTDCLAVLPESVVQAMSKHHDIVALSIDLRGPTRKVGLISRSDLVETTLQRRFRAHLLREISSLPV